MRNNKEKVKAIILAAGRSERFGGRRLKPFTRLGAKTILEHSILPFQKTAEIDGIVVVLPSKYVPSHGPMLQKQFSKIIDVVSGGPTRAESMMKGLKAASEASIYLIHDGVRPFVSLSIIRQVIEGVRHYGASIAAAKARDTVKEANDQSFVFKTLDRNRIFLAQTPQGFKRQILKKGLKLFSEKHLEVTDDSTLVEQCGMKVKIIESEWYNFKITTSKDLEIAKKLKDVLGQEY